MTRIWGNAEYGELPHVTVLGSVVLLERLLCKYSSTYLDTSTTHSITLSLYYSTTSLLYYLTILLPHYSTTLLLDYI